MGPAKLGDEEEEDAGKALLAGPPQQDPKVYPMRWYILSIFVVFCVMQSELNIALLVVMLLRAVRFAVAHTEASPIPRVMQMGCGILTGF